MLGNCITDALIRVRLVRGHQVLTPTRAIRVAVVTLNVFLAALPLSRPWQHNREWLEGSWESDRRPSEVACSAPVRHNTQSRGCWQLHADVLDGTVSGSGC